MAMQRPPTTPPRRAPFDQLSKVPLVDPCGCPICGGLCERKVPNKWKRCRSCAMDFHGIPCEAYLPDRFPLIVPECEECGLLEIEH